MAKLTKKEFFSDGFLNRPLLGGDKFGVPSDPLEQVRNAARLDARASLGEYNAESRKELKKKWNEAEKLEKHVFKRRFGEQEKKKELSPLDKLIEDALNSTAATTQNNLTPSFQGDKPSGFLDNLKGFMTGEKKLPTLPDLLKGNGFQNFEEGDKTSYNAIGKVLPGENPTEFDRFLARTANTASLNTRHAMSNEAGKEAFYNSREFGEGGGTDLAADMLGYLAPGMLAVKGLRAAGLGANIGKNATLLQKGLQYGKEGALVGAGIGLAETPAMVSINPEQSPLDHLKRVGLETAIGGIADPALMGVGAGLSKLPIVRDLIAKLSRGEINKQQFDEVVNADPQLKKELLLLSEGQQLLPEPITKTVPKYKTSEGVNVPEGLALPEPPTQPYLNKVNELQAELKPVKNTLDELTQANENQFSYLKSSMKNRKGVQQGTIGEGQGNFKEVTGTFRHSENPGWYQDFYKKNGRAPNNAELRALAEEQVLKGFKDESMNVPPYQPKAVDDIEKQINELTKYIEENPQYKEALAPNLAKLKEERIKPTQEFQKVATKKKELSTTQEKLQNVTEKFYPKQEGSPLSVRKEMYNPLKKENISYTGKVDPMNKTKAEYSAPKVNDKLLNSLEYGDQIKVRKDRGEVELSFVKREGDSVVVKRKNGKETVVPASMVNGKVNNPLVKPNDLSKKEVAATLSKQGNSQKGKESIKYENISPQKAVPLQKVDAKPKEFNPKVISSEKDQLTKQINEVRELKNKTKEPKAKEQLKKELGQLESKLKVAEEKRVLNKDTTFDKILSKSDSWKDKSKIRYKIETMDRNFEDIMGKKDAKVMKETFLDPIKSKEADRIRFLNDQRGEIKSLKVKPKSEQDKLIQMYGEGPDNGGISLEELKKRSPKGWKQIKEKAEFMRTKYDSLLDQVNKVLTEAGETPIPKRKDYFPHYEEIDGVLSKFGFDITNNTLPTDINGLTDQFKPNKQFFANALKRKGDKTTYGMTEGFDRYIEGISNVIHHVDNIKRLRKLENSIRSKYEGDTKLSNFVTELKEYTNNLAGKKTTFDRAFEDTFGRTFYNVMDTIRRKVGVNMIGANLASAMTSYIPLTQSLATTNKKAFMRGMVETMTNIMHKDDFIQQSDFLTKRIGADPLVRNLWDKTIDASMWMMKTMDMFSAQTIVRSKYHEGISKGLSHKDAMKKADDWAARIMADRSKGSMPTLFNSKTLGPVTQFQLEVNNQLAFLMKDIPRESKNFAATASAIGQLFVYSYLFNNLYEKIVGRRTALDPIGIVQTAIEDYENPNLEKSTATRNLMENTLNQLPFTSLVEGGRFPINSAIPSVPGLIKGDADVKKELTKPLFYILPPAGGGQVKKTYEGLQAMNSNPLAKKQPLTGLYKENEMKEKRLQVPVKDNLQNKLKGGLFGKYSLPEVKEYYRNENRILSPKQTKEVEGSKDPKAAYNVLQLKRNLDTLNGKMKKVAEKVEKGLISEEKGKKEIRSLDERMKKMLKTAKEDIKK